MVTENEARIFLREYRVLKIEVKVIETTIEELRESVIMPASANDGMPRAKYSTSDLSDYAAKLEQLERRLSIRMKQAIFKLNMIEAEISKLDDKTEAASLRLHYICGKTWEETAEMMNYSRTQIFRIQADAVRKIAEGMEPETRNRVVIKAKK